MSVRRLAEEAVQPADFAFTEENAAWAKAKIAEYPSGRQQSAVIPLLWRAQEQEGWVARAVIERIADMLSMPYIRVLEVATFYTQFLLEPMGTKAHVQLCGTTPCMLRGAEELRAVCQSKIHHDPHHTNADGTLSWEEVECMGACVNAPMVMIGHDTYEDLTPERLEEIIDAFAEGKGDSIEPGPQIDRRYAAAETGATTLTDVPTGRHPQTARTGAGGQEPTKPGRKRDVPEEAAPAVKEPKKGDKVTEGKAEAAKHKDESQQDKEGKANKSEREEAKGSSSAGGKLDGGAAVGKPTGPTVDPKMVAAPGDKPGAGAEDGTNTSEGEDRAGPPGRTDADAKPMFATAEGGAPDDLKKINGVGPTIEAKLNGLGITRFEQIANLTPSDIERVDAELNFRGRIGRENWVEQARQLAEEDASGTSPSTNKTPR